MLDSGPMQLPRRILYILADYHVVPNLRSCFTWPHVTVCVLCCQCRGGSGYYLQMTDAQGSAAPRNGEPPRSAAVKPMPKVSRPLAHAVSDRKAWYCW